MNKKGPLIIALLVAGVVLIGWEIFRHHAAGDGTSTLASQPPDVAVAKVSRQTVSKLVTIPAEFRPYVEAILNAKVAGYVNEMNVDFGDHVKAGQLLATIEVPELQAQLDNAAATLQKARADHTNADLIYTRLYSVNREHPGLVAQQDLDTAEANDQATAATISASLAEVEKFQTLTSYTNITAPFDGVVTWRYADPGALIQAGTSSDSQSLPLVRVSDNYLLRLDFPVSVEYVKDIHLNDLVRVQVDSVNNELITGKVTRFTDKVSIDTRTMMVEIEVPNPDLTLIPGMYATVMLDLDKTPNALVVPSQAITGGKNPEVYVVNSDNEIEERPVTLGLEMPDKYQILSGLNEGETVVVGDRSDLWAGRKVTPKLADISMNDENQNKNVQ